MAKDERLLLSHELIEKEHKIKIGASRIVLIGVTISLTAFCLVASVFCIVFDAPAVSLVFWGLELVFICSIVINGLHLRKVLKNSSYEIRLDRVDNLCEESAYRYGRHGGHITVEYAVYMENWGRITTTQVFFERTNVGDEIYLLLFPRMIGKKMYLEGIYHARTYRVETEEAN